ncbi:MAG: tRNA lysidine(34) synthetase TilS [Acidimicrobiia bacterium]|nr:tRNA lysidine(34) synthetase TilS [Acidimicrobiia bacterium]MDH5615895.1 tRNA lysidine(34) synthetase TilS [Acidimicrobiia bacterium]
MAGSRRLTGLSGDVLARVEENLPKGPLVVALSGGADSAVCAWAADRLGAKIRAVHVDHGWPASAALRKAAHEVSGQLAIDILVVETQSRPGPSPEGQARLVRYEALEAELASDEWLLTGHTMDDQAETVLGNLLRGAGAAGLSGIPRRRGRIVRPLLDVSRAETRELAALLGLLWADDPTNLDTSLRRNALRREVIPFLETRINPSLQTALVRLASSLEEDERLLDAAADAVPVETRGKTVRLPAPLLATLPGPVAARAVRRGLREVHDGYPGSSAEVMAILSVARGGRPTELAGSIRVERNGSWVTLERPDLAVNRPPMSWPLPGTIDFGAWTFEAWLEETPPLVFPLSPFTEVFDADAVPASVVVRTMEPGDRVAMVGGTKPLTDVFGEARISPTQRSMWPVVVTVGDVIWVPGVRRAAAGWVGTATRRYLWLRATLEGTS